MSLWLRSNRSMLTDYKLLGAVISTSTFASSSPTKRPGSSSNKSSSSSGLSTGAKAAIGASIGGVAVIALVVLGLFLVRRRKRRQVESSTPTEPMYEAMNDQAHPPPPLTKYEMHQDSTAQHELPTHSPVEAPINERPAELPGHAVQR